ncbi:hypothetical protein [Elioraea rosea]|uniref:hypothetical protein n=1 Tax=Elioraea rosea TaxID=2492390 RepID=UPI0011838F47|nr:hypothetical protein [Elioraea rosea]
MVGLDALEKGMRLREEGKLTEAEHAFAVAAPHGIAEGWIQLAQIQEGRGEAELARLSIREAEKLAEQGDTLANSSRSLVYVIGHGLFATVDNE